jgi:site-specific DNA recombinase
MTAQASKYLIYARKSTEDEEKQQLSIPGQITELKQFASENKIKVEDILTETKSAKTPGRKVFNQLLSKIEKGEAQGILSWHPDRLARNAVDAGQIGHFLNTGKLLDLKFPSFWFEKTPQGLFMLNMAFSQSQYFSDALSVNTARGLRQKARTGHFPGFAPRGYLNNRLKKTIKVDKKLALTIKKMFSLYSTGTYTLGSLSQKVADLKLISPNGNNLSRDAIKKTLQNPFYYGDFFYGGELYPGKHEPLISKKLFDQVQKALKKRGKPRKSKRQKVFPFTGLITCGHCGMKVTAETQVKRYKNGTSKKYIYYHCTRKNKKVKCKGSFVRQPEIDHQLTNLIKTVTLKKESGQWMLNKIYDERKTKTDSFRVTVEDLQNKVLDLSKQLKKLLDLYIQGNIEQKNYLKTKKAIVVQRRDFERKIIKLQQSPNQWLEPMEDWVKLAMQAETTANETTKLRRKRQFLLETGSNLTLTGKKIDATWPTPWARLTARATSRLLEPSVGFEPTTCCLQNSCSNQLS